MEAVVYSGGSGTSEQNRKTFIMRFTDAFQMLCGEAKPHGWQAQLASDTICRSQVIRIPTGLGKTAGIMAAWAWNRILRDGGDKHWPRRLVWCLPMRVLVEQTLAEATKLTGNLPEPRRPHVVAAMGGLEMNKWFLRPEDPAIIVGTQDMLLSRALNRGYGSGRARWPVEYGLLNHDALWVMDEIQLMDVGLATSAQIQAYRDQDASKGFKPCHTWWMSATLQDAWLRTVDTEERHGHWIGSPIRVPAEQRTGKLWEVKKDLQTCEIGLKDQKGLAARILEEHNRPKVKDFGRITLVVCNTVERACETYDALLSAGRTEDIELIHSRFRPHERRQWRERFLNRKACEDASVDRIIVATQVVEAGVDISATCLVTELAPWPSLVQRFGRCARYGGTGNILVVNRGLDDKGALPYSAEELKSAWDTLARTHDAGIGALELLEAALTDAERQKLYPYDPPHLLLHREFVELFDTTPDLTGADLDISRFIRTGDERDLQVFWRHIEKGEQPSSEVQPRQRELCSVPFLQARDWLCGAETKTNRKPRLRHSMRAWIWDWLDGEWVKAKRETLHPGRTVIVDAACGGYLAERGFTADSTGAVAIVPIDAEPPSVEMADAANDRDDLSNGTWKTIACHAREVVETVNAIAAELGLREEETRILGLAALWHDVGKAHPVFQGSIREVDGWRPEVQPLAKAPDAAWLKPPGTYHTVDNRDSRPGFRHELASALAIFAVVERYAPGHPALVGPWVEVLRALDDNFVGCMRELDTPPTPMEQTVLELGPDAFNLLVYLIAAHHGKVRMALHASPKDQDYLDSDGHGLPIRGVREADTIPSFSLDEKGPPLPELSLTLEPAKLGLSSRTGPSWRERTIDLLDQYGPAALAYLEAVLRAADVRASRLSTPDPALTEEAAK